MTKMDGSSGGTLWSQAETKLDSFHSESASFMIIVKSSSLHDDGMQAPIFNADCWKANILAFVCSFWLSAGKRGSGSALKT